MFVLAALLSGGCGYHVAGRNNSLPQSVHVLAVLTLENKTTSYRIEQMTLIDLFPQTFHLETIAQLLRA